VWSEAKAFDTPWQPGGNASTPPPSMHIQDRSEALLKLISKAMGREAIRVDTTGEGDTSAFIDEPEDPEDLVEGTLAAAS
jgi:hypothetical protein